MSRQPFRAISSRGINVVAAVTTVLVTTLIPATGQAPAVGKVAAAKSQWAPAHTPDGQPDIQGAYARAGIYGLAPQQMESNGPHGAENPLEDSAYSRLPDGQRKRGRSDEASSDDSPQPQGEGGRAVPLAGPAPPGPWRLGLVDPADKVLPWKPEEDKRRREFLMHTNPAASLRYVEFRRAAALPGLFLERWSRFEEIYPTREESRDPTVSEYQHYTRTIHLDGRPHVGSNIRLFMGDSIGHWDGNTLIVDTTNFNEFTSFTREIPYLSERSHVCRKASPLPIRTTSNTKPPSMTQSCSRNPGKRRDFSERPKRNSKSRSTRARKAASRW